MCFNGNRSERKMTKALEDAVLNYTDLDGKILGTWTTIMSL